MVNVSLFMLNALTASRDRGGSWGFGAICSLAEIGLVELNLNMTFDGDGVNGDLYGSVSCSSG